MRNINCQVGFGNSKEASEEYGGFETHTKTRGTVIRKCQMWSGGPHDAKQFNTLAEDWCRNPDESPEGVWCYTLDKEKRWDYCPVRRCSYCDSGYSHTNYRGNHYKLSFQNMGLII